jgi:hypothetical protein
MDLRIDNIFLEEMMGDTSFREKDSTLSFLFGKKYSKEEVREIWHRGIRHGIEIGLRRASLEGQRIELYRNTKDKNKLEFIQKFEQLANEYNCAIQYHPVIGMCIINKNYV